MNANVIQNQKTGIFESTLSITDGMRICAYPPCSKSFRRPPSMDGPYCSRACRNSNDRKLVSMMCEWCAQAFAPQRNQVAKGYGRFCSRQCGGASRQRQVLYTCAYCGKEFPDIASRADKAEFITCSRTCKAIYQAQQQLAHFWDNVDMSGGPDACWPWMGSRFDDRGEYGRFFLCGKSYRANRLAFIFVKGPLLDDEESLHHCDNPPCCNPEHLFKGTSLENTRDMVKKGRQAHGDHVPWAHRSRGTKHHTSKLTDVTARACYALKGQMTQIKAGAQFGIHQTIVSDLWNHKILVHIHNS